MHVLTVLDHPDPASFTAAIAHSFMEGSKAAHHTVELADLHTEGFNPIWSMQDVEGETPADVRAEQTRIERADAICLVFPLFWWGMPSMMKGWVDRVWTWGWAYDQLDDPDKSLLKPRSGVLLVPAGARSDEMETAGYQDALNTSWIDGTFGYFGLSPRRLEVLNGSTGSVKWRQALLAKSYDLGMTLQSPEF